MMYGRGTHLINNRFTLRILNSNYIFISFAFATKYCETVFVRGCALRAIFLCLNSSKYLYDPSVCSHLQFDTTSHAKISDTILFLRPVGVYFWTIYCGRYFYR